MSGVIAGATSAYGSMSAAPAQFLNEAALKETLFGLYASEWRFNYQNNEPVISYHEVCQPVSSPALIQNLPPTVNQWLMVHSLTRRSKNDHEGFPNRMHFRMLRTARDSPHS